MFVINIILFISYVSVSQCRVPDKVYCVNEECNEPISKAKTLIGYNTADPDLISYPGNADALIFMKSAGTNADLWYATINGKSGFVNSKFLREYKILQKTNQVTVPFEKSLKESIVQPDKVQKPHEVIDGTTIYTTEPAIYETTTEIPATPSSSIENYEPTTSTKSPVNLDKNANVLNTLVEDHKLSEKPVNVKSHKTPNSETNNEVKNLGLEPSLPQKNTQVSPDTHQSNSGDIDLINTETKSQHDIKLTEDGKVQQPANENSDVTRQSVSEKFAQPQDNSAYVQPLEKVETISVKSPTIDQEIPKLEENKQSSEKNADNNEQNAPQNKPEVSMEKNTENRNSEPVILHSDNNIREPIAMSEPVKYTEQVVTEEPHNVQQTKTINNVNENIPSTESNTEAVAADIKQTEPTVDDKPLVQDNINQDNHVTSVNPEHQQMAPIIDNVHSIYSENSNENIDGSLRMSYGVPDRSKTVPPVFNTESPTIQPEYKPDYMFSNDNSNEKSSDISQEQVADDEFNKNQETNNIEDSTDNIYSYSTESATTEDSSTLTTSEPSHDFIDETQAIVSPDESTEGILSSIYTTISDIWPTTTESPKNIFNSEDYPSYEKSKIDGEESFSFVKYIISMYSSILGSEAQTMALFGSSSETCFTNEYCDGSTNDRNNRLLTFLLTTASSVLLFTLGYYYIDIKRQDGRLIGTINSLQRDLLFATKECEILKEELATTKNKLAGIEDSSFGMDDMVQSLKEEINELKVQNERLRNSLDANEKLLRVSENTAGELQNTLSDVENTLSELFAERASSEEQIVELNDKIQAFEEELISVSRERDNFQLKYVSAETSLEEARKQMKQLDEVNKQLAEAKNTIELQKHEITALKDALKELKSNSSNNVDVTSLIDHTEIKAKLAKALEERNTYANKYEVEYKERLRLTEEQKTTKETLHTTSQQAAEAMTRLEVLGKYFQERESELLKELSSKESLWLSKQGESASTIDKIDLLQQEVQRYKEKCDALTLELAEQESTRRTAVSEVEARAHTAWLEARAARREADAARDEAATLRRKLASLSTADGAVSPHHKVSSPLDNSENPIIPPPLPPLAFLPPPLLPPLPRPPPLGRLPSPHPPRYNDRRYSPDSRYSPESRYSPGNRYSPETVRYSPDSRYSPRQRRTSYSPRSRRRSRERYQDGRGSRSRNLPPDTETEYPSDSPSRDPRRRNRYSRHSGPSSGSGCSSESDK